MISTRGTVLKVLLSNARFLASLHPWSLGPLTDFRSWSSSCHSPGPAGSFQASSRQRPGAEQPLGLAALKSVRHQSSCSSSTGSSRKAQQRQQAQARRPQPQQDEQQQCRQQFQSGNWPEALELMEQRDDMQIFRGGVVTPMENTPLWRATFYGNVPSRWWPKDSSSKYSLLQAPSSSSVHRTNNYDLVRGGSTSSTSSSSATELSSSRDDLTSCMDRGDSLVFGSRNGTNSTSGSIPSWNALISSSSSAVGSLFRVSQYPKPQPYWRNGELCYGNKPTLLVQISPAAEFNRAARAQLMQRLRPVYSGSSASIRVGYAERSANSARWKQRQTARQEQHQQLDDAFNQLLQLSHQQLRGQVEEGCQMAAADWKRLVRRTSGVSLLLKQRRSHFLANLPIDTKDVQQQRLVKVLELVRRRLAAQQQKRRQQQRFRLRSHSSVATAAVVLSNDTYPERKQVLLQQPAVDQQLKNPAKSAWYRSFVTLSLAASEIPRVGIVGTQEDAALYLASCGSVYRCAARQDKHGAVLPMPRHCIPGYCSLCREDSNSSSSSIFQRHQQPEREAELAQQQQQQPEVGVGNLQQQQQRRQQHCKSACVAGVGCDAIVKRGRKRTSRARRHYGWWAADLFKSKKTPDSSSHNSVGPNVTAVVATAVEASVAAAEAMPTPTDTSPVELMQEQQLPHRCSSPGSSSSNRNFSGSTNFVIFEKSDVARDDSESDDDSDYDNERDSDDDMSDDEANELLYEEEQLSPVARWALEEPYVFRNNIGVIYGFWSKCPMG